MVAAALTNALVGEKGLADRKNEMCCEQKEARIGVMGQDQGQGFGSSEDGVTRVDDAPAAENNGAGGEIQVHDGFQIAQQQSQNSVIRWERFLPIRSLKVLLVENDDSTRHVVSALLRNCSYEGELTVSESCPCSDSFIFTLLLRYITSIFLVKAHVIFRALTFSNLPLICRCKLIFV